MFRNLTMPLVEIILVALYSIQGNLFRAMLTMLGIIIGVGAVITMIALGSGAQRAIDERIAALGSDVLSVYSGQSTRRGVAREQANLTVDDSEALAKRGRFVTAVVPEISRRQQLKWGNRNTSSNVVGTTPNYASVNGYEVEYGRMFTSSDNSARRRVVVLGAEVPELLNADPKSLLGRTLLIRSLPFKVIGIFKDKGSIGFGNPDNDVWIPLATAQHRVIGTDRLQSINVEVAPDASLEQAMVDMERILRHEHKIMPGRDNNFVIFDRKQYLNTRQQATEVFTFLLAGIAGISLIVGGIGIMNIMLVTVTERTREIGVRKAMGATRINILLQFLVESMTLCVLGGIVGILLGVGASLLLAEFAGWQTYVTWQAIMLAFLFSAGTGLIFGIMPAQRAAKLDPIEALRYE